MKGEVAAMQTIDFDGVQDVKDFSLLPPGRYFCRLVDVEKATARSGLEYWKLKFEILSGPYTGRLVFDRMFFSEAALSRVKHILVNLGVEVSGKMTVSPPLILGKSCALDVEIEEYTDIEGTKKKTNRVPFAGYHKADSVPEPRDGVDEFGNDVPF